MASARIGSQARASNDWAHRILDYSSKASSRDRLAPVQKQA
jgi:hypothetical protein